MIKGDKTRSQMFTVKSIVTLNKYLRSYRIGFNGYSYLILIVNRFRLKGETSTYTSVYNSLFDTASGNDFRAMREAIFTLERKGLIAVDRTNTIHKLYPTEKSLKEISAFI